MWHLTFTLGVCKGNCFLQALDCAGGTRMGSKIFELLVKCSKFFVGKIFQADIILASTFSGANQLIELDLYRL